MADFNNGKNIGVVIQLQKTDAKSAFALLEQNAPSWFGFGAYAYILHDKDVLDNGQIKGPHIHLVLKAKQAQSSNNWLKTFAEWFSIPTDAISVDVISNERKLIRYLLHLDDADKHQYDRSEVRTNMVDVCRKYWEANNGFVSAPTLEQLEEANRQGVRAIYNLVGLNGFKKAQSVLDAFNLEDSYINRMTDEVERLYKALSEITANPAYIRKGYIPLRDYQDVLDSASKSLQEIRLIAEHNAKGKKGK